MRNSRRQSPVTIYADRPCRGITWRDMPGPNGEAKKLAFALFRRGKHPLNAKCEDLEGEILRQRLQQLLVAGRAKGAVCTRSANSLPMEPGSWRESLYHQKAHFVFDGHLQAICGAGVPAGMPWVQTTYLPQCGRCMPHASNNQKPPHHAQTIQNG